MNDHDRYSSKPLNYWKGILTA